MLDLALTRLAETANSVGLGACLALLVILGFAFPSGARGGRPEAMRAEAARARIWLAVFIALLGYELALSGLESRSVMSTHLILSGLGLLHLPLLPIVLLQHVRALAATDATVSVAREGRHRRWRHVLATFWPVGLAWLCLAPFFMLTPDDRMALWISDEANPPSREFVARTGVAAIGVFVHWLVWMALLAGCGWRIAVLLQRHDRWLRSQWSNIEHRELGWVRRMLVVCALAFGVTITDQMLTLFSAPNMSDAASDVFVGLVALGLGAPGIVHLLREALRPHHTRVAVLLEAPGPAGATEQSASSADHSDSAEGGAYARSGLDEADCDRILAKLDAAMTSRTLWRDPQLSLRDLSDATGVRPNHISQALNSRRGRNFFDYVNGFRIEDAKAQLLSGEATVLEICEVTGFNAKSTFNAAFRKHTGLTPTQFRSARARD